MREALLGLLDGHCHHDGPCVWSRRSRAFVGRALPPSHPPRAVRASTAFSDSFEGLSWLIGLWVSRRNGTESGRKPLEINCRDFRLLQLRFTIYVCAYTTSTGHRATSAPNRRTLHPPDDEREAKDVWHGPLVNRGARRRRTIDHVMSAARRGLHSSSSPSPHIDIDPHTHTPRHPLSPRAGSLRPSAVCVTSLSGFQIDVTRVRRAGRRRRGRS